MILLSQFPFKASPLPAPRLFQSQHKLAESPPKLSLSNTCCLDQCLEHTEYQQMSSTAWQVHLTFPIFRITWDPKYENTFKMLKWWFEAIVLHWRDGKAMSNVTCYSISVEPLLGEKPYTHYLFPSWFPVPHSRKQGTLSPPCVSGSCTQDTEPIQSEPPCHPSQAPAYFQSSW